MSSVNVWISGLQETVSTGAVDLTGMGTTLATNGNFTSSLQLVHSGRDAHSD